MEAMHESMPQGAGGRESTERGPSARQNVGQVERWASALAGGGLALAGLRSGGWRGTTMALVGGALVYRGVTGHSNLYEALGVNTAARAGRRTSVKHGEGIKFEKSVIINRRPEELYRFWRNFENLPNIMSHLESVQTIDDRRSRWRARGPAGQSVEWEAEIINETPNRMIAWRSLEGADIPNAGSVHFEDAPNGRGTLVRVVLNYSPPAGKVGAQVARWFGEEPELQVEEDLLRFKRRMEGSEPAPTEGPASRRATRAGERSR